MALDLLNVGDSRAVTKAKMDAAFVAVGLPASGDTTEATNTFNELVTDYLFDPLPGLTDGLAGGTARSRINAAITALNEGGWDALDSILGAGGRDYAYFDFTDTGRLFQDDAGTIPADEIGEAIGLALSPAGSPLHSAQQTSASFKPVLQAAGAKGDGNDDRLLTALLPGKLILARFTVPATVSSAHLVAGAADVSGSNCFQLGYDAAGRIVGGAGSQSFTTIVATGTNVLDREAVAAIWAPGDGQTLKLFCDDAEVYSAAQSGTPTTAVPMTLLARNTNGVPDRFSAATIRQIAFGSPDSFSLAEFQQIRQQWLNS